MTENVKFSKNEEAVSPVVASILLIAICMIMAAVIAAFSFGIVGDSNKARMVSFSTERYGNATNIVIMNTGGRDVADIQALEVSIDGRDFVPFDEGRVVGSGRTFTLSDGVTESYTHIVIRGTFQRDEQQILLDTHR